MHNDYNVGDVLYVLDSERQLIIPIQIYSATTRKTLEGTSLEYEFVTPNKLDRPMPLSKIKDEVFRSPTEVKELLMSNAVNAIKRMVDRAEKVASIKFSNDVVSKSESDELDVSVDDREEQAIKPDEDQYADETITLPDGTIAKAKIKLPDGFEEELLGKSSVQKAALAG